MMECGIIKDLDFKEGMGRLGKFKEYGLLPSSGSFFIMIVYLSGLSSFFTSGLAPFKLEPVETICFTLIGIVLMILGVQFKIVK